MADEEPQEAQGKEALDVAKFKQEVAEMNKAYVDQATQNVISQVSALLKSKEDGENKAREIIEAANTGDYSEFKAEIDELGLDEKGAKALVNIVEKYVNKKAPVFERNIISKVDSNISAKQLKEQNEDAVLKKYPQVADKTSNLWKRAQERFASLSDSVKSSPEGTAIAVELAASDLGVKAAMPYQNNAMDAGVTPGGGQRKDSKISSEQTDFAKSFGVKEDTFKKNLKMISSR